MTHNVKWWSDADDQNRLRAQAGKAMKRLRTKLYLSCAKCGRRA